MKKIFALVACLSLVASLAVGGSIAYLKDDASTVNVMTLGKVEIEVHEYEREVDANGTYKTDTFNGENTYVLKEYSQPKPLYPYVGGDVNGGYDSTQVRLSQLGHNSRGGMEVFKPEVKNVQDKFVFVENTGKSDAYVRTFIAFEAGDVTNYADWKDNLIGHSYHSAWKRTEPQNVVEINGNNYFVFEYIYDGMTTNDVTRHKDGLLPPGDYTYNCLGQVYMNSAAENEDVEKLDGNKNGTYDILVLSQAVQAAGFVDAKTALDTAFGVTTADNVKEWFKNVSIPTTVSTAAELKDALAKGGNVVLAADVTMTEPAMIPADVEVTLDLNGKQLNANNTTYVINNHGTLTLYDSVGTGSMNARGIYNGYDAAGNGNNNVSTARLIVKNGTYNATGENGGAAIFNYGIVEIEDGTFMSIGGYSLNNQLGSQMTIKNATVTGGIYNVGDSLTIHDGSIATNRGGYTHAIYHDGGLVTINGGTFSGNGNEVINANSSEAVINGGTFTKVEKTSYLLAGSKMVINGGTFNAHEINPAAHPVRPDVTVKGGTFNYKHKDIAEGYQIVDNGNGTWTVTVKAQ